MSGPIMFEDARTLMSLLVDLERMACGGGPSRTALASAPVLARWHLCSIKVPCLIGSVTGHPILGNTDIVTSPLVAIDPSGRWARTRSRWYALEGKVRLDG